MSNTIFAIATVAVAALSPPLMLSYAPYFKRTSKARVKRFQVNFLLWTLFAPMVALVAYFLNTPQTTKAAIAIFDWWIFTSIGLGCLILCLITIIVAYKRDDPLRSQDEHDANTLALMEFSGFVLNNAQSLWVIAGFLVAAGGDLATIIGYGVVSVMLVFVAWVIAP